MTSPESIGSIIKRRKPAKANDGSFTRLPIRPQKKRTRLFIDNEYFGNDFAKTFPHSVLAVYAVLAKYANQQTQTCFPSFDTIMQQGGIANRNTVSNAIKILEAYNFIAVRHSKGGGPNFYTLLDSAVWSKPNSIIIDTIKKPKKLGNAVSKNKPQQYQKQPANSIAADTGSLISKSSNEVKGDKINFMETEKQNSLTAGAYNLFTTYYKKTDIEAAIEYLKNTKEKITSVSVKTILKQWSTENKIISIKPMNW